MKRLQVRVFLCISPGSDSDPIQASVVVMFNILIGNMMDDTTPTALFSSRQPPGNERAPQESLVYWLLPAEAPSIPETCCRHQQMSCDTPHILEWNRVVRPTATRNRPTEMRKRSGDKSRNWFQQDRRYAYKVTHRLACVSTFAVEMQ